MISAARFTLFALVLGMLVASCNVLPPPQADATRYYVLALPAKAHPPSIEGPVTGKLRIGLKRVELAGYLKNRSLVVDHGHNEITLADTARWAEPLENGITRLLRAELLSDPAIAHLELEPFPFDSDRDWDVSVYVTQCEGSTAGRSTARFSAIIEICQPDPNGRILLRKEYVAPDAAWNGDYGRLATLLSTDVAALSREIVASLPPK